MVIEMIDRPFHHLLRAGRVVIGSSNDLALHVVARGAMHKLFQSPFFPVEFPIQGMELVAAHEKERRENALNWISQDGDISRRLGEDFMQSKKHMSLEHLCSA